MQHRKRRQVVGLRQREGGTWDFEIVVLRQIPDQRAGGGGFSGAEIARQCDDVARAEQQREIGHQLRGCGLIGERGLTCRGFAHSAALR